MVNPVLAAQVEYCVQHESTIVAPIPGLYDIGTVAETFTSFGWMSWVVPLLLH